MNSQGAVIGVALCLMVAVSLAYFIVRYLLPWLITSR